MSAGAPASTVQPVVKRLPQSLVSAFPGVITDRAQIHGYARTDVVPGMPLMADQFGALGTGAAATGAAEPDGCSPCR